VPSSRQAAKYPYTVGHGGKYRQAHPGPVHVQDRLHDPAQR
jgi:hypothetical protein